MTRIAVILGSTRPGRRGADVAAWVVEQASRRTDATFELVDVADYALPHLDEPGIASMGHPYVHAHTLAWAETIAAYDGYIFVTAEYNHSVPSALKGAIDFLNKEWANKAAGFVAYGGSAAGARAVEHLRLILAELRVATVRTNVLLPFFSEFGKDLSFQPGDYQIPFLNQLFDEVVSWADALRPLRSQGM